MRALRGLIAAAVAAAACDAATPTQTQPIWQQHATAQFLFHYTDGDAAGIAGLAAEANARAPRVAADLGAASMAQVRVYLYPTHAELASAVRPLAGDIPSWATGLVTSARDIHLLSTRASTSAEILAAATTVTHEFAHCATLHINPQSANNPRWLWETVAVYEAGQTRDPRTVPAVAAAPPAIATLNGFESTLIYDIGHTLGLFITERAGADALRRLVLSHGDTQTVLGMTPSEMLGAWHAWARARYGF